MQAAGRHSHCGNSHRSIFPSSHLRVDGATPGGLVSYSVINQQQPIQTSLTKCLLLCVPHWLTSWRHSPSVCCCVFLTDWHPDVTHQVSVAVCSSLIDILTSLTKCLLLCVPHRLTFRRHSPSVCCCVFLTDWHQSACRIISIVNIQPPNDRPNLQHRSSSWRRLQHTINQNIITAWYSLFYHHQTILKMVFILVIFIAVVSCQIQPPKNGQMFELLALNRVANNYYLAQHINSLSIEAEKMASSRIECLAFCLQSTTCYIVTYLSRAAANTNNCQLQYRWIALLNTSFLHGAEMYKMTYGQC